MVVTRGDDAFRRCRQAAGRQDRRFANARDRHFIYFTAFTSTGKNCRLAWQSIILDDASSSPEL